LLVKKSSGVANWYMQDVMRGMPISDYGANLFANLSNAEAANTWMYPTATGFAINDASANVNESGATYIYIAIRRGPMKTPTVGTSVFAPVAQTGGFGTNKIVTTNFPVDLNISGDRGSGSNRIFADRLRGGTTNSYNILQGNVTNAESTGSGAGFAFDSNINILDNWWNTGLSIIFYNFRRAPGFFDEVCYTGTGVARTVTHNLTVAPELMITKNRTSAGYGWLTYSATLGATKFVQLNSTAAEGTVATYWNNTAPTSSVFSVGTAGATNASADNFVAYLFATCAGVSKVGSYTGTGTTLQIDCGFTAGARFVLIKRTDSTGDWYVWDSARGIIAGNDPYLLLNSSAAEVTNTDYVDSYSAGFELSSTAPAAINANGGTYIFLAIA